MKTRVVNISRRGDLPNPYATPLQGAVAVQPTPFEEGVVTDVILDETHPKYAADGYNVGVITFRFLTSDRYRTDDALYSAFPLNANIQDYPLLNEVIVIYPVLNRFYYGRSVNVTNRVTAQAFFSLDASLDATDSSDTGKSDNYYRSQGTPSRTEDTDPQSSAFGKYFVDNQQVHRLKSFEGDVIFQGRFGNTIRFGSATPKSQQPNLLLRVGEDPTGKPNVDSPFGLVTENLDGDRTSLWLVSDQIVTLKLATQGNAVHFKSVSNPPSQFAGAQLVANTDRIILNAKQNDVFVHAHTGIHLTTLSDTTVDASGDYRSYIAQDIDVTSGQSYQLTVGDQWNTKVTNDALWTVGGSTTIRTSDQIGIVGSKIHIGSTGDESEPQVLGASLKQFLSDLIDAHLTFQGTYVMTSMGPGALVPGLTAQLQALKARLEVILSQDNFVSRTNG